jgi:hypothetical protein
MKKVFIIAAMCFLSQSVVFAQKPAYEKAMTSLVAEMQTASYEAPLQGTVNKLERIAAAEPTEWLPNYWVAFGYISDSFKKTTPGEKDQVLDLAEKALNKAKALVENDELEVLTAQYASARMSVSPMDRWQTYGAKYSEAIEKATKLNPENPRIYYLQGTNMFYTPENFGGGKAKAKPFFEKALMKFEAFKSQSNLHPNWGKVESNYFLEQCK